MASFELPPEAIEAAQRVKRLRVERRAAQAELDRIDSELQAALDAYQPIKGEALQALLKALGEPDLVETAPAKPAPKPLPRAAPRPLNAA